MRKWSSLRVITLVTSNVFLVIAMALSWPLARIASAAQVGARSHQSNKSAVLTDDTSYVQLGEYLAQNPAAAPLFQAIANDQALEAFFAQNLAWAAEGHWYWTAAGWFDPATGVTVPLSELLAPPPVTSAPSAPAETAPSAPTETAPAETAPSEPAPSTVSAPAESSGGSATGSGVLSCIAAQESGNDPGAVNSYSGAGGTYQIIPSTWAAYGGTQFAPSAQDATPAEQTQIAQQILSADGLSQWSADSC